MTALKMAALNALMKWLARDLWPVAQDMVCLFLDRDDLSGAEKRRLALVMLQDKAREIGRSFPDSFGNFLIEAAVQTFKKG